MEILSLELPIPEIAISAKFTTISGILILSNGLSFLWGCAFAVSSLVLFFAVAFVFVFVCFCVSLQPLLFFKLNFVC